MSEIKVNSIKGVGASTAAITVNNTDGTCTVNNTNRTNRRLTINGDMRIAQRGTSSTTSGYGTVDRWQLAYNNTDNAVTQSQVDVASGTTPYSLGFRKAYKATNGNQTSGAANNVQLLIFQKIEAQDIANSGWNYTDPNSKITLSFWVKSSIAQNFYIRLLSIDGTLQNFPSETGSLSANTWTKVTKTISGNSNLTFDNNTDQGLQILFDIFMGTNYTDSGVSLDTWADYASGTRTPDQTSTWYTTNNATFEITGVQLEVSDHATSFQFRSFAEELALCQRYYFKMTADDAGNTMFGAGWANAANQCIGIIHYPQPLRDAPSALESTGNAGDYRVNEFGANHTATGGPTFSTATKNTSTVYFTVSSITTGRPLFLRAVNSNAFLAWSAEL